LASQNVYIKLAEIDPELAASVGKVREGIKALKKTINDVSLPTHAPDTDTPSKTTASSEQTSEPWASVKRFLLLHQKGGTIKLTREQQAQLVNIWPELTRRAQELQSDLEDVKKKVDKRDLQLAQALADLATTRAEVDTARAANERLQQEGRHMTAAAAARQVSTASL
jgi:chromosome segregation ATPase